MSLTRSLNRLENDSQDEMCLYSVGLRGHRAKWQIQTNDVIEVPLNLPKSIELWWDFIVCLLSRNAKFTDNLFVGTKVAFASPSSLAEDDENS